MFHSDRGRQYASGDFGKTLAVHGLVPSMSRKGNCRDNEVTESLFATLRDEEATGVYEISAGLHRPPSPWLLQSHALALMARLPFAQRQCKEAEASGLTRGLFASVFWGTFNRVSGMTEAVKALDF